MEKRILIVDDHPLIALGIENLLDHCGLRFTVDNSNKISDAFENLNKHNYELIILDVFMPEGDTHSILHRVFQINPNQKVLIHSSASETIYASHYLRLGANGFVSKGSTQEQLTKAIQTVISGKKYISDEVKDILLDELTKGTPANPFLILSKRVLEVAKLLAMGYSNLEIAKSFNLHASTIGTQKTRIYSKLGVNNQSEFDALSRLHSFYKT